MEKWISLFILRNSIGEGDNPFDGNLLLGHTLMLKAPV
jgi:hypothetical protein